MRTTARSLILDLLSTLRRGTMPVRALVEAGAILGIAENNIRVSLTRLHASGHVERDERGAYRLGPAVAAMSTQLRSWRFRAGQMRSWSGDWVAVHAATRGRGPDRRRRENALSILGFAEFESGLWLRPNNLRGGVAPLRVTFDALCAETDRENRGRLFRVDELDQPSEVRARALWDGKSLRRDARRATTELRQSARRIPSLSQDDAMSETFLLGGGVLRQLIRHPLLPKEILDPAPLDELLAEMKRYDELGRRCWAPFLASHDVPHRALPLDARQSTAELTTAQVGA